MKIIITYEQELPAGTTKEQAEQWFDFEINGGTADPGNPLIDNATAIENVNWKNLVEMEIDDKEYKEPNLPRCTNTQCVSNDNGQYCTGTRIGCLDHKL